MVQITGNNLSKRHRELNTKVNEAAASNVNFEEIKSEPETSDVDRLFKIDLAAKYKNVDYIIETLKSGDSLYISRALKKALWLYDDEHASVINTDNLHQNIFPFMSIKMRKKFMTVISMHLENTHRAADFYNYCIRMENRDLAHKFLLKTCESFKLNLVEEKSSCIYDNCDENFVENFLGNSFVLFEAYLKHLNYGVNDKLSSCSYFYAINDVKYLDLLEKHANMDNFAKVKLGLRISKDIVTKHKDRVLTKPKLYINILRVNKLIRHSNLDDLKFYAVSMLPVDAFKFWDMHYYKEYKPIIHAVPEFERFTFLKKIFSDNYPQEEFEMSKEFYKQKYHDLMTVAEKEAWALSHIAGNTEILGGRDYILYKYVSFEKAFVEIKKLIKTATDQAKRLELLKVLAQCTKTPVELEKLLDYYYVRHVNEKRNFTEAFLKTVMYVHNVFEFGDSCWEALNKIFYSDDVYNPADTQCNPDFKIIAILHHIINNKEMPEALNKHIEYEISMYSTKKYLDMLDEEKKQLVYTYICNFYLDRIKKSVPGAEDHKCIAHVHFILEFMAIFKKTKEDIPEAVMEFVNHDLETFRYQQILQDRFKNNDKSITDDDFVRLLKEDSKLVVEKIPEIKKQIFDHLSYDNNKLNRILHKLKIYFPHDDVTQELLKLFDDVLTDKESHHFSIAVQKAVYGMFKLSDEKCVIDLMNKYAPSEPKIDHTNIDSRLLEIREAICRFACYSRPPVPLSNVLMYLKGDYVKYCLPMFHMYLANLPQPLCLKFVESLLDSPVSIQKHGLRLAFKCFSTEDMKKLVQNAWQGTKNVSLRSVIYKAFHEKTVKEQDKEMYATLKSLTLDLHNEDDDGIFSLITSRRLALRGCEGDFIEAVWATVEKLKDNEQKLYRKTAVVKLINESIHLMNKDTVTKMVSDDLNMLFAASKAQTFDVAQKFASLYQAKWDLIAHYIVYFTRTEEDRSESVKMAKLVLSKCLEGWNDVAGDIFVERRILADFIEHLKCPRFLTHPTRDAELLFDVETYENASTILEEILNDLQTALPLNEIYMFVWDLRISIISRKVVKESREKFDKDNREEVIEESAKDFGKQLGLLVKEFVDNNIYFSYFTPEIAKLINNSVCDMECHLKEGSTVSLEKDHILVATAQGLLETDKVETNLLALQILPTEPKCNLTFYKSVFDAIQKLPHMEVKCCLDQKFCGDFKRKRLE